MFSVFSGVVLCYSVVEEGLSYRFHASWPFVLQILGCFYRAAGKQAYPVMMKVRALTVAVFASIGLHWSVAKFPVKQYVN